MSGSTSGPQAKRFIPRESVEFLTLSPTFTPFVGEVSPDLYLVSKAVGLAADREAADRVASYPARKLCRPARAHFRYDCFSPGPVRLENPKTLALS